MSKKIKEKWDKFWLLVLKTLAYTKILITGQTHLSYKREREREEWILYYTHLIWMVTHKLYIYNLPSKTKPLYSQHSYKTRSISFVAWLLNIWHPNPSGVHLSTRVLACTSHYLSGDHILLKRADRFEDKGWGGEEYDEEWRISIKYWRKGGLETRETRRERER